VSKTSKTKKTGKPSNTRHGRGGSGIQVKVGAGVGAALLILGQAFAAMAQEFVKVEDGAREQLPATPFVGVAYGFIWLAVLLYVLMVARGVSKVNKDIAELRRRLDRSAPETSTRGS
jgi:hypothetical protein